MKRLRAGPRKTDVRDVADRVDELTDAANDTAVCCVLRWAKRTNAGPTAAVHICSILGLDLRSALTRARTRRTTQ
jgi:hypothetical protein